MTVVGILLVIVGVMRLMGERRGETPARSGRTPQLRGLVTWGMIALGAVLTVGPYAWQAWSGMGV